MKLAILTGVTALALIVFIFELLRRRQLREKYAVLWLVVGLLTLPFGFHPESVDTFAGHLGVKNGASLVLFVAVVFLLLVCIHLSWEASQLEDETRTLAEEIALIRTELRDLKKDIAEQQAGPVPDSPAALTDPLTEPKGPETTLPGQREGERVNGR